jgi:hypothetical protein
MSPSEWSFGVISDVASGIITRNRRSGFKWRKGSVATFSGERGSNGEKEVLRHFLEIGVQIEIGVEDYIRDEVRRIIFCSCVTLDFG